MATKTIRGRRIKTRTENQTYLSEIFSVFKRMTALAVADKNSHYSDTELRLIGAILAARSKGERLISTEIAERLGVTRSAVSQIVKRLEAEEVVRRVPDDRDRKIAYIELTKPALKEYEADMDVCAAFVGRVVEKFGRERFEEMCALIEEFAELAKKEKNNG